MEKLARMNRPWSMMPLKNHRLCRAPQIPVDWIPRRGLRPLLCNVFVGSCSELLRGVLTMEGTSTRMMKTQAVWMCSNCEDCIHGDASSKRKLQKALHSERGDGSCGRRDQWSLDSQQCAFGEREPSNVTFRTCVVGFLNAIISDKYKYVVKSLVYVTRSQASTWVR